MLSVHSKSHSVRRGFTLIELVVVLAILAALAGLIIPRVDFLKGASQTAAAASSMQDIMSNLQLYKTTKGVYPNGFDSLLTSTGGEYTKVWSHGGTGATWGAPASLTPAFSATTGNPTNADGWIYFSMAHAFQGNITTGNIDLYDHDDTTTDYSNSGTSLHAIDGTAFTIEEVTSASVKAQFYPGGVPTNIRLFAFGVGQKCGAVGATMTTAPLSSGIDSVDPSTNYCRYIAVFAIATDKTYCQLKGVIDPLGNNINARLTGYYTATANN